jgi:hypothetical protein
MTCTYGDSLGLVRVPDNLDIDSISMSHKNTALNRPQDWQAFERLTRDLFQKLYRNPHADKHGSDGQRQHGVDVSVRAADGRTGIQCKGRNDPDFLRHKGPMVEEFKAEIEKAKSFRPPLDRFVLVTTAKNNATLKRLAEEKTDEHFKADPKLFDVDYHAWD